MTPARDQHRAAEAQRSPWRARFRHWSEATAKAIGSPMAFFASLLIVLLWAVCGPFFGFSDTWQLIINTGTTIVTFLVVFLIQNTQNRDTDVINLKLDELLRAIEGARTSFVGLNDVSDEDLADLHKQFSDLAGRYGGLVGDDLEQVQREIHTRRRHRSERAAESAHGRPNDA